MESRLIIQELGVAIYRARRGVCVASCAGAILVAGCSRVGSPAGAEADGYFQKAKKLTEMRDYREAAAAYEKALQIDPQLAPAHLEVGLLYDDKLNDPISAMYHYRCFLKSDPPAHQRQLVEDFMERAKFALASKLPQSPVVDPGELARLQSEKAALMQENSTLKAKLAELGGRAPARPIDSPSGAAGAAPSNLPVAETTVQPATPRTHSVEKGDTLQSLALHYYGTRSGWEKIFQANRTALASKDQLKIGQELVIP